MNNQFDEFNESVAQAGTCQPVLEDSRVGAPQPSLHLQSLAGPKRSDGRSILAHAGSAALCLALANLLTLAAGAQTYDAVADFSTNSNPNGVWSYRVRSGTLRDGNYPLLQDYSPSYGFAGIGVWGLGGDGHPPDVGVNQTGGDVPFFGTGIVWPTGAMRVHPGGGGLVIVSWLSPSIMSVNIDFSFTDLDPNGPDGISWFVEKNDSSGTLSSGSYAEGGESGPQSLSGIPVIAGDRINFIVDPNGDYTFDSTKFTATISTLPGTVVGPRLQINPAGEGLLLRWPTNATGFVLETSARLGTNQNWTAFHGSVIVIGDQNLAAVNPSGSRFFRLHKP